MSYSEPNVGAPPAAAPADALAGRLREAAPGETDAAATCIAGAATGAAFLYLPAAAVSGDMAPRAAGLPQVLWLTADGGRPLVRLSEGAPAAGSAGKTDGFRIRLPDAVELAASGNRVRIRVVARAAHAGAAPRFAVAYSTNEVGNSGWQWFTARADWATYEMSFAVPPMREGKGDFVGLLPDAGEAPGVDVCAVAVAVEAGRQKATQATPDAPDLARLARFAGSPMPLGNILAGLQREVASLLPHLGAAYGSERLAKAILLKTANLALMRLQYARQHINLIAKPIAFLVDPSNACQLRCPGCIHGDNFKNLSTIWDKSILDFPHFAALIKEFGPYAMDCLFYNWGEPLINRKLPQMIKMARQYLVNTRIHTNLSLSFDVPAIVASGLDSMTLSIDGVSQSVLQVYRRGARAQLIFDNIRKLVAEKERVNSYTPYIIWKYIMFDHNIDEMAEAEDFARELGINEIFFTKPYPVNDPKITMRNIPGIRHVVFKSERAEVWNAYQRLAHTLSPEIDAAFDDFLELRVRPEHSVATARNKCLWLYEQTVMDANGRILPCCKVPWDESWSFGEMNASGVFNSEKYVSARELGQGIDTACHGCPATDASFRPNVEAAAAFPQFLRRINWLGLFSADALRPLWDDASHPAAA